MASKKKLDISVATDLFNTVSEETHEDPKEVFGFDTFFDESDKEALLKGYEQAKASGVEMVDIDLLDANPLSRYHMRDEESLESLKALIRENGFEQSFAIVGKKKPDGRVTILSGHRRTAVAKSLKDKNGVPLISQLPITYKEFDREVKELEFVAAANLKRADNISDLLNMYDLFSRHYDNGEWTEEELAQSSGKTDFIAKKMGVPESKIRHNLFLLKYDQAILTLIDQGVISVSDMRKLHSDNEKGRLRNHDEIVKALAKSKVLKRAGESEAALAEAKKEARNILAGAERKYDRKKKPENAGKVVTRLAKDLAVPAGISADGMEKKERTAALKELKKVKKEIERLESILREG